MALALVVAVWLWWGWRQAAAPEIAGPALSPTDTTAAIDQELSATDFGDLETELQSTEADLQSL